MSGQKKLNIICFGEVLWDMLPAGKVAGGAPMNLAFHANNLGVKASLISAVGTDTLGAALLQFLEGKSIPTDLIQNNSTYPTSTVQVTLDEKGSASYEIVQPVSWDFISLTASQIQAVEQADIFLFGSLACRSEQSRKTLFQLIKRAKKIVFDVNLRPPFYSQSIIEYLLEQAHIVKMNEEELDEIAGWYGSYPSDEEKMRFLSSRFNIETIVLTKGSEGAFCLSDYLFYQQPSFSVEVSDTIGAGDSFLAAFLTKLLGQHSWSTCLKYASATGAIVATKVGGTPDVDSEMVETFLKK